MENYLLDIDKIGLQNLLFDFYTLTKIRIVVFDNNHNMICSYPNDDCKICKKINSCPSSHKLCIESNKKSFEKCSREKQLIIYKCHAGLIEATSPIINENGVIIGYIMFGQITDEKDKKIAAEQLRKIIKNFGISATDDDLYIKYKSPEQIHAAAKILETCTLYLLNKNMICLNKNDFIYKINEFIDKNLSENLSIEEIAKAFNTSRTNLYYLWKMHINIGIAEYVKNKRIEKAKWFLKYSRENIVSISQLVGFNDYNYFCRVFKKEVGMPAKKYRDSMKSLD